MVRTTPYGLQACSEDVLRQQEVSQLWLHSQTKEKVRWGENRRIITVVDCLDAFTPSFPEWVGSEDRGIILFHLENHQELSENLLDVDCFGSFAARQQPRRHRYFCNFCKFFVFNSFDEEIYCICLLTYSCLCMHSPLVILFLLTFCNPFKRSCKVPRLCLSSDHRGGF